MEQAQFWLNLEHQAFERAGEMDSSGREDLVGWWCDGIEPGVYALDAERPYIEGTIWLGRDVENRWRFRLDLRNFPRVGTPEEIDWEAMYPAPGKTGWLTIDTERGLVIMDFSVQDEPEADIILRADDSFIIVPRHAPTPDVEARAHDAIRTYLRKVHTSDPESLTQ